MGFSGFDFEMLWVSFNLSQLDKRNLSSARLSILINGKLHGYFACSRGVRQGDPLSPLLFGLAEDALSRILHKAVEWGRIQPMVYCRGVNFPTHVLYADDIFIFVKATTGNIGTLASILDYYAAISGQVCSPEKSRVFYGNGVREVVKVRVQRRLGFVRGSFPTMYLGIRGTTIPGCSESSTFEESG